MIKVLFVCLGNICRSPMAEGVFKAIVSEYGLSGEIEADSAGTSAFHIGANPDRRMCQTAEAYHKARQFTKTDFEEFDHILPMDNKNLKDILALAGGKQEYEAKVKLMREFDLERDNLDVPDPYYGGMQGFEDVYVMLERSSRNLLEFIADKHGLKI
jgi:protein-tyrosine phosphatase